MSKKLGLIIFAFVCSVLMVSSASAVVSIGTTSIETSTIEDTETRESSTTDTSTTDSTQTSTTSTGTTETSTTDTGTTDTGTTSTGTGTTSGFDDGETQNFVPPENVDEDPDIDICPDNNQGPTADAGGPYNDVVGEPVQFDGSDSYDDDEIVYWEWNFGDGNSEEGEDCSNPTHIYSYSDTFSVTLKVYDGDGESDIDSTTATISNNPPTADAGGPYVGEVDEPILFDGSDSSDSDGEIVSWSWDFGDGNTGSGETVEHIYDEAKTYTIELTVTDNAGATDSTETTASFTDHDINCRPIADAGEHNNGPYYTGTPILFDGSDSYDPDGDSLKYRWDFNNDGEDDTDWLNTPIVEYAYPSINVDELNNQIEVKLTVMDEGGLYDTDTSIIEDLRDGYPKAQIEIIEPVNDNVEGLHYYNAQPGDVITLYAGDSHDPNGEIAGYTWQSNLVSEWQDCSETGDRFTITVGESWTEEGGSAKYRVKVFDEDGNSNLSKQVIIHIGDGPSAVIIIPDGNEFSVGDTVHFDGRQSYAGDDCKIVNYKWWFDQTNPDYSGSGQSTGSEVDWPYTSHGIYIVHLLVESEKNNDNGKSVILKDRDTEALVVDDGLEIVPINPKSFNMKPNGTMKIRVNKVINTQPLPLPLAKVTIEDENGEQVEGTTESETNLFGTCYVKMPSEEGVYYLHAQRNAIKIYRPDKGMPWIKISKAHGYSILNVTDDGNGGDDSNSQTNTGSTQSVIINNLLNNVINSANINGGSSSGESNSEGSNSNSNQNNEGSNNQNNNEGSNNQDNNEGGEQNNNEGGGEQQNSPPDGGDTNSAPTAEAGGPYSGDINEQITFDASGSSDPDGDSLEYRWNFDGGLLWDTSWSSSPTASHSYDQEGTYTVKVQVRDGNGIVYRDTDTATVTVINPNSPPVINGITGPSPIKVFNQETYTCSASDPDGDSLEYKWYGRAPGDLLPHWHDWTSSSSFTVKYSVIGWKAVKVKVRDTPAEEVTGPEIKDIHVTLTGN